MTGMRLGEQPGSFGSEECLDFLPRIRPEQVGHGLGLGIIKEGEAAKQMVWVHIDSSILLLEEPEHLLQPSVLPAVEVEIDEVLAGAAPRQSGQLHRRDVVPVRQADGPGRFMERPDQRVVVMKELQRNTAHNGRQGSCTFLQQLNVADVPKLGEEVLGSELLRSEKVEVPGAAMPEMQGEPGPPGEV